MFGAFSFERFERILSKISAIINNMLLIVKRISVVWLRAVLDLKIARTVNIIIIVNSVRRGGFLI
jgi:hypothetical protein